MKARTNPLTREESNLMKNILMFSIALVMLSCAVNVKKYAANMPEAMKECALCHSMDEEGRVEKRGRVLNGPVTGLCRDCHAGRIASGEHRVGMEYKGKTRLPLYEARVECSTCHEPHGLKAGRSMLRVPAKDLCASCHNY